MYVLIAIALKSLLVAGATLGVLQLMKRRSASERSWIAHLGLLSLILLAFAPLVLPAWNVETPVLFEQPQPQPAALAATPEVNPLPSGVAAARVESLAPATKISPPAITLPSLSAVELTTAAYALPAAILLVITFLALLRLFALRARADVLVDGHWLSALARAQRRMGFKHGTALLTSNELASPISWGLMRPVILLNTRAVEAAGEAEAIISHELAHVARLDWAKLLLARIATAMFWFNPLVWMLAREAHQLREEAADDAVLAADIVDTDYAQLLVGVARHECSGLLLGAHGVAPSKSSLARRVARVLDGASARAPVARSFALGVFTGALLIAAPLAALTLTPAGLRLEKAARPAGSKSLAASEPSTAYYPAKAETPTDLPSIIADGVSTSVATAAAVVGPLTEDDIDAREEALEAAEQAREDAAQAREDAREQALEAAERAREAGARAREEGARAREAGARAREEAVRAREVAREARNAAQAHRARSAVDVAIELKALGVTPEYISAMRSASPQLARLEASDFSGMKAVGVTPEFVRRWASSGFRNVTADQLTEARAVGLTGDYVREMMAVGVRGSFDDYVQLRVTGVSPGYVSSLRRSGVDIRDPDKLTEMRALGVSAHDLKVAAPPKPPRAPKAPPPANWDPANDADPGDG